MRPGDLIADRFEIVRLAGAGGMGRVYEARDRLAGEVPVALKVLSHRGLHEDERFAREATVLAGLRHPGVVRYLTHGATSAGDPYLVMEWLEGEPLSERLRRTGLGVAESLALARRLAAALGAVHRDGLVHRDLKPSNVFLPGGSVERATLIDFGVARASGAGSRLTFSGVMVGTPGYMAPEQVHGERDIDARADVFSLGCVLFKCLTGRDAFRGQASLSVLLKVMVEEPPRAGELRQGISAELDALLARWMMKRRALRPRDGDAAAAELEALGAGARPAPQSLRPAGLDGREITTNERKLMCLLLVRDAGAEPEAAGAEDPGRRARARVLRAATERHRGQVESLGDDALLVVLTGAGAPTDLAARAARCALAVRAAIDGAPVSLVTGRAEVEGRLPVGELIERAVRLLPEGAPDAAAPIRVDDVTAGLLGARFELGPGLELVRELDTSEPPQVLLGRPTSCVGRDREIATLEAVFAGTAADGAASAVLVTGPPGVGKSRLRYELLRRLRARGEPFELWSGYADPMSAGSAFGLLARAVRGALGVGDGDPVEARREAVRLRAAPLADGARVAAFLGELVGAPLPDEESAQLRAARRDPVLMGDQIRRAAEDLLRAACAERPVLLVLEDLQWSDLPTVTFIDSALRNLAELPLLVLALARPEARGTFPRLWAGHAVQTLQLGSIPRRAAERLVRQALDDAAPPEQVAALVERADGNPFHLEELIRAVATGRGDDLPETVLAMAQARIERLDADVRRVLRAASVFGGAFTQEGVEALLGGAPAGHLLAELVEGEVIVRRAEAGGAAGGEHGFRHALMREAAYGMLTEGDRAVGHELAGDWLEREGHGDAMTLAEHFERARCPSRAAVWYRRAAELALEGDDLGAALERAGRAAASGAAGAELGAVRLIEAEAHLWRGALAQAEERGTEAAALLAPGGAAWLRALTQVALAASKLGIMDRIEACAALVTAADPVEGTLGSRVVCLSACVGGLAIGGRHAQADAQLARLDAELGDPPAIDPAAMGPYHEARAIRALTAGDPGICLGRLEAALAAYEQAGDRRRACTARSNLGFLFSELGDFARAEESLRAALAEDTRMGIEEAASCALQNLGNAVACAGRLSEGRRLQEQAEEMFRRQGNPRLQGISLTYLAQIALLSGDAGGAERHARAAAERLVIAPPTRAAALAVLARALLRQGRAAEALVAAEEAFTLLVGAGGALEEGESLVRLVHAEALAAAGREEDARGALTAARARLHERAARIHDPGWRERFLRDVPDNAAILAAR